MSLRLTLMLSAVVAMACNDILGAEEPRVSSGDRSDADENHMGGDGGAPPVDPPPPPTCGDGMIQAPEECDDGNESAGDGCAGCVMECGPAPEFPIDVTGHCYLMVAAPEAPVSFVAAEAQCEAWGGHLASATTADEYALIQQRVTHPVWMGATAEGGAFMWVDGEAWNDDLDVWAPGEPTDAGDCARFETDSLALAAADCNDPVGYVCERIPAGSLP